MDRFEHVLQIAARAEYRLWQQKQAGILGKMSPIAQKVWQFLSKARGLGKVAPPSVPGGLVSLYRAGGMAIPPAPVSRLQALKNLWSSSPGIRRAAIAAPVAGAAGVAGTGIGKLLAKGETKLPEYLTSAVKAAPKKVQEGAQAAAGGIAGVPAWAWIGGGGLTALAALAAYNAGKRPKRAPAEAQAEPEEE